MRVEWSYNFGEGSSVETLMKSPTSKVQFPLFSVGWRRCADFIMLQCQGQQEGLVSEVELGSAYYLILDNRVQVDEIGAETGDPDNQVLIVFRVNLSIP
jgi:hypothetical protein